MHHMNADKTLGEKVRWELHKNAACRLEQILEATSHKKKLCNHLPPISQTL